jgi:hypothetical protein
MPSSLTDTIVHQSSTRRQTPMGIKVLIGFLMYHLLLVTCPAWSFFQYDTVSTTFHLEEPRIITDEAVVQTNRAIGFTNLIFVIPLNIVSIIGLLSHFGCSCCCWGSCCVRKNHDSNITNNDNTQFALLPVWVLTISFMVLGIALYWPILYLSSRYTYSTANIRHVPLHCSDLITLLLVLCMAIWSVWYLASSSIYNPRTCSSYSYPIRSSSSSHAIAVEVITTDDDRYNQHGKKEKKTMTMDEQQYLLS